MAIKHIELGAPPLLWSNVKYSYRDINDNFQQLQDQFGQIGLNDLIDVNTTDAPLSIGDVLAWDGTRWEPSVPGGVGAAAGIGWTVDGPNDEYRVSSTFTELNDEYTIRAVRINNDGLLELEIATFNPTITTQGQTLAWDEAAGYFRISVDNPADFTSRYISSVRAISNSIGVHTELSNYTIGPQNPPAAGGVAWHQEFNTNNTARIISNGSGLEGGIASATLSFNDDDNNEWYDTKTINYTWQNANTSINFSNLSGRNFLGDYSTVDYIVGITGIENLNNTSSTVTVVGGVLSNTAGSGTLTFAEPLHKNNNVGRSISVVTTFNRPAYVTGTAYSINDNDVDSYITAEFIYPSFYIWTINNVTPPTRADIISSNNFSPGVIELGNQVKTLSTYINNSDTQPRCFWFAVRSNAAQPTVFETGPTESLLSTVEVATGNTVELEPDTPLPGYISENYTLYGITLQPGDTYVRIN